ncbi:MAG: hypothetical protein REH79_00180 [Spiroplasma sp.]|nr:hypothetical protein [Spiroplasma sp.]
MSKITWKRSIATIAVFAITVPLCATLIALNSTNEPDTELENVKDHHKKIVEAINNNHYHYSIATNSKFVDLKNNITSDFIKEQLSEEIQSEFKNELFKINQITIDNRTLTDYDLITSKRVDALINYNYGEITNQTTKLTINIIISTLEIIAAINEANYEIATKLNSTVKDIKAIITGDFIKTQLPDAIAEAFESNKFQLINITVNTKDLQDHDLTTSGVVHTEINYSYDEIIGQTTKLAIKVTVSNEQIVETINKVKYQITTASYSTKQSIDDLIISNFIKEQLSGEINQAFNEQLFKFNKIIINNRELQDSDLEKNGIIAAKINYSYDEILNQETNLTIKITVSSKEIVSELNKKRFAIDAEINVKTKVLDALITGHAISERLPDEVKAAFNEQLFKFNKIILKDGTQLTDDHLTKVASFPGFINYDYDNIVNQNIDLTINIRVNHEQIVEAINNEKYAIETTIRTPVKELENLITANFIKEPLDNELKKAFQDNLFTLNKITIDESNLSNPGKIDAKINYTYGAFENQETNLEITINADEKYIVDAINHGSYKIEITTKTSTDQLKNKITGNFIKAQLNREVAEVFNVDLFKLNKITYYGKVLEDKDLEQVTEIKTQINYDYGNVKDQQTNLTIKIIVSDQQIVDAINKITYQIAVTAGTKTDNIKNLITSNFIHQQLSSEIKNVFQHNLFKMHRITLFGNDLKDDDLKKVNTITTQIVYDYGDIKNQQTNLKIIIDEPKKNDISTAVLPKSPFLVAKAGSIGQLRSLINVQVIKTIEFQEMINKIIPNRKITENLKNYQVEGIYRDKKCLEAIITPDLNSNKTLYVKINGIEELTGTLVIAIRFM